MRRLADFGRLLWFDTITGLNDDNTCGGCHSPTAGFGDTQSIAIGIDNNGIVGPDRTGPRNQRRTPMVMNTAFYPSADVELALRMRSRAIRSITAPASLSRAGRACRSRICRTCSRRRRSSRRPSASRSRGFDFPGDNDAIRDEVAAAAERRCRTIASCSVSASPTCGRARRSRSTCSARAIAEFEFTLVFADAPIDRFARGAQTR